MKRAWTLLCVLVLSQIIFGLTNMNTANADTSNLIPNHSGEALDGEGKPQEWIFNSWGTNNATGSMSTEAFDGTKSFYTKISDYVSGDAKWYVTPFTVTPNTTYTFSNAYKATATSETVLQYQMSDGAISYQYLSGHQPAASWTSNQHSVTTPANASKVSVFHVLTGNGELWTDSYVLKQFTQVPSPSATIENSSVENAGNNTLPADWFTSSWGQNSSTFNYLNEGSDGTRSVRTTVTNYVDGDAKWYFAPVALTANKDYVFSDYYRSNIDSRIVLAITTSTGTTQYQELPGAPASSSWARYSASFTMPVNGVSATVFHMLSANGTLDTDNYDIKPYQVVGFNRGLVTLTFDDGWENNTTTALPVMKELGFKSNQFYATSFIKNPSVSNPRELIQRFTAAGHEIGSHTVSHPDLTTLSMADSNAELRDSQIYLQNFLGKPVKYFATPYGAYNSAVKEQIMSYYSVHRTVDAGYNSKDNFDISRLKVQNVLSTTTTSELAGWVKKAKADKTWLILVYHRVGPNPGPYDTTTYKFKQQLNAIKNNQVPVKTITGALSEITPQL